MDTVILKCIFSLNLVLFTANLSFIFFLGVCDRVEYIYIYVLIIYIIHLYMHIYIYTYIDIDR